MKSKILGHGFFPYLSLAFQYKVDFITTNWLLQFLKMHNKNPDLMTFVSLQSHCYVEVLQSAYFLVLVLEFSFNAVIAVGNKG